jgi:ATP-dependent DNA helicase RecG
MEITLEYIQQLASSHEGVDVEFKETTGQLNRGMETLCGMMNGNGGIVVFGITNSGKVVGQEVADKTTREIGEALNRFEPAVNIQPHYIHLENSSKCLIAFVSDGMETDKPYLWDGKSYQRHDSVTTVMPRERFLRLHESQKGLIYHWENETDPNLTVSMLDEHLIMNIIQGGVRRGRLSPSALNDDIPTALSRLRVAQNGVLCRSAAVLFGKDMWNYPQCMLRLARFKGTRKIDFIDNQQFEGNIFGMVDAAMAFFFKHLSLSGTTRNRIQREDELEIPYDALREAVVNACCHRAWQQEASTIGIAIYDDRVEIENAGRFPATISPMRLASEEEIHSHNTSMPPNPVIANVMFISGLIEHWGRGLSLMDNECKRVELPVPQIYDDGFMVRVSFDRKSQAGSQAGNQGGQAGSQVRSQVKRQQTYNKPDKTESQGEQVGQVRSQVRSQAGSQAEDKSGKQITINKPIVRLIRIIGEDWLSASEILQELNLSSKGSLRKNYIIPAMEMELIKLENPSKPSSPNQRYGLTMKGKSIYYREK